MATVRVSPNGTGDFLHPNDIGLSGNEAGTIVALARGWSFRGVDPITAFGDSSNPFIITCYGDASLPKPIVSGRAIVTAEWTQSGDDWYIASATQEQLWLDKNTPLLAVATQGALTELTQYYDSSAGRIYIRSLVNPNTLTIEITTQASALSVAIASDGVEVNNIEAHGGNTHGIFLGVSGVFTGGDHWQVSSCDVFGCGTNRNGTRASDAILIAGDSNTGLVTNAVSRFNTVDLAFNNAIETHFTDGLIVEGNKYTRCGGGVELWKGNANSIVRYNRMAKIDGTQFGDAYMGSLLWINNFTGATNNQDSCTAHHNLAVNCQHGFKMQMGTGHSLHHNNVWGFRDYGLIMSGVAIGAVEFSDNVMALSSQFIDSGSQGRFVEQAVLNATAPLTGDNNAYYTLNPGTSVVDGRWKFDNVTAIVFATHQAAAAPNFDQASVYDNTESSWVANPDMDSQATDVDVDDYEPVASSQIDGVGLNLSYKRDMRGQFIDASDIDVGPIQRRRVPLATVASSNLSD